MRPQQILLIAVLFPVALSVHSCEQKLTGGDDLSGQKVVSVHIDSNLKPIDSVKEGRTIKWRPTIRQGSFTIVPDAGLCGAATPLPATHQDPAKCTVPMQDWTGEDDLAEKSYQYKILQPGEIDGPGKGIILPMYVNHCRGC